MPSSPEKWPDYLKYLDNGKTPPGKRVFDKSIKSGVPRDEPGETLIDVSPALTSGLGHAIVVVKGASLLPAARQVQDRRVGPGHRHRPRGVRRSDGPDGVGHRPGHRSPERKACSSSWSPGSAKGKTNKDGLATLPLSAETGGKLLLARSGKDVAFVPQQTWWWGANEGWKKRKPVDTLDAGSSSTTARCTSRARRLRFKGWLRRFEGRKGGDIRGAELREVTYKLRGARGNELAKGTLKVGRLGSFSGKIELPDDANLGWANLILQAPGWKSKPGEQYHHGFQIQEFRRPEYEVTMEVSEGPHRVGGNARLTASAQYYAGGSLANADVRWDVVATETSYTPPNRSEFTFGRYRPWWMWWVPSPQWKEPKRHKLEAKTDGGGKHAVSAEFVAAEPPLPHNMQRAGDRHRREPPGVDRVTERARAPRCGLRRA